MKALFLESLRLAGLLRPAYGASLGAADPAFEFKLAALSTDSKPSLWEAVYSTVKGTSRAVTGPLMDFVPGYRLLHIDDLAEAAIQVRVMNASRRTLLPLLANLSSDYVCVDPDEGGEVCAVMHDSRQPVTLHRSSEAFLETVSEFYRRGIYFLDADGYLDYDLEAHGKCGSELNPGVMYWVE